MSETTHDLTQRAAQVLDGRMFTSSPTWEIWAAKDAMPLIRDLSAALVQAEQREAREHVASTAAMEWVETLKAKLVQAEQENAKLEAKLLAVIQGDRT
jgi:hypothetical protein